MTVDEIGKYAFFPADQPAPSFTLTAVKSGRQVTPKRCDCVLGLVFHGRETVQAVVDINTAVRPIYPEPTPVILASVVDLSVVPRLLHRAIKPMLDQAYDQAAKQVPAGYNPADYVYLIPDWDGKITKAFQVKHPDKTAAVVVIDRHGQVAGSYQGPQPGAATLNLVQAALNGSVQSQ